MKSPLCPSIVASVLLAGTYPASAADIHVPANYPNIQAAVEAAVTGDTIRIAPGVYVEQVRIIGKNLTLIGQPGSILRAFPGMQPPFEGTDWERTILLVNDTTHVSLRGLTFEGDQLAAENPPGLRGVTIDVAGGTIEDCRFSGFREKTPGSRWSEAVVFWNAFDGASRRVARVFNTTIVDSYSGIAIYGAKDVTSYEVALLDNTISGVGLSTAQDLLQGIHLGDGTTGVVARNRVSGFAYDGTIGPGDQDHPIPFGILRLSSGFPDNTRDLEPMTFEDNVLSDNQVHLAFFAADDTVVRNNTFQRSIPFTRDNPPLLEGGPVGLWFTGANVQVTGNHFSNLEQGILLAARRDLLGTATDATLADNRFCEVATQRFAEPGATFTERGTLTCPFPNPALNVTRLSWPGIEDGFSVQSAPAPNGPWNPLDTAPVRRDGQNQVLVPAAADQQFFRLAKP